MTCVRLVLDDGSVVLVNVKPRKKITEEDMKAIKEFYESLKKKPEGDDGQDSDSQG